MRSFLTSAIAIPSLGGLVLALSCVTASADDHENDQPVRVGWQPTIEVDTGHATRGPWRMNESEWDFIDDPAVAINDHHEIGVAWVDHVKQDLLFQRYDAGGEPVFDDPVNVSRSSSIFSWLPRIVMTSPEDDDAKPRVDLLWQEIVFSGGSHGGEIFFARSLDGGETFSAPINLSNSTAGAGKGRHTARSWHNGSYDLVRANDGTLYAAWTEYEGNLWFSRSTDGGESFSDPAHIAGESGTNPARGPSLAVGRDGTIYLAWTVGEDDQADIRFTRSTDRGDSFDEPRVVQQRSGHADAPKLAVDGDNVLHLVYGESESGRNGQYRIIYSRASDESRTFSEPRIISGEFSRTVDSANFPMLAIDGDDRLIVTWETYRNRRGRPTGTSFVISTNGGESFSDPQPLPGTGDGEDGFHGSQQGLLMSKLAVNRSGTLAFVNSTFRQNHVSRVRLFRGVLLPERDDDS